ncbi:MAG TPA: cache domain-containing protein, partial [Dissulfurispiraceae bacterium]|nr:cache domain-containing protein [Dissulfurispiraceae bacterium]
MVAILLFLLLISIAAAGIYIGYGQYQSVFNNALISDKTAANVFAEILRERQRATIGILQSYASRPLLVQAVKRRDASAILKHMEDLKRNNREMDLTFMTDEKGILLANYPAFPEAIGQDLSDRDWYKRISEGWKPSVSNVFQLIVGDKPLAVAVAVPIFNEKGDVIGILANSQRIGFIDDVVKRLDLNPQQAVTVIDRSGQIVYSNKYDYAKQITVYPLYSFIDQGAMKGEAIFGTGGSWDQFGKGYIAISSLKTSGWMVIAERTYKDILKSVSGRLIQLLVIALLLFSLITAMIIYNSSLERKAVALSESEGQYRAFFKSKAVGTSQIGMDGHFLEV